jgi:DNA-binding NarL/FixJ family response regulator
VQGALTAARLWFLDAFAADDGVELDRVAGAMAELGANLFGAEAAAAAAAAHRRAGSTRRRSASQARSIELRACCTDVRTPLLAEPEVMVDLTAREREVAELAAVGWSSREIAASLGRSVRTVENHLQRAYDKLGVTGRSDLAAVFGRSPTDATTTTEIR